MLYDIRMKMKLKEAGALEEAVLRMLGSATRTKARKLIKGLRVSVDDVPESSPGFQVRPGQTIEITRQTGERPAESARESRKRRLQFTILFEDEHLIVVDKPAGLLSIATDKERSKTLYRMVSDYVKATSGGENKIFIVHRLDRDVSGAMVFAKDEKAKRRLQESWGNAQKVYHAVVDGRPGGKEGTVQSWLCENRAHRVYACDKTTPGAEEAVTHYRALRSKGSRSVVEVRLETGRKHQIRVHLASIGCPVAGDRLYGTAVKGMSGIGLHAVLLSFDHPSTGRRIKVKSPLPRRLRDLA